MKAVQKLLICDYLFRSKNFDKRREINKLYEEVKRYNGEAVIFSSMHPSGEKLKNITGIAAILRHDVLAEEHEDEGEELEREEKEGEKEELFDNFDLKKLSVDEEDEED
jgi:protein pelota